MEKILIIGGGWEQAPIILESKRKGFYTLVVDYNSHSHGAKIADEFICISTKDYGLICDYLATHNHKICAVSYMISEAGIESVYKIAQEYKLPSLSLKSMMATLSKTDMRELLKDSGMVGVNYGIASKYQSATDIVENIGLPVVIKPSDTGGQRGMTFLTSNEKMKNSFDYAKDSSFSGEVIIEELLIGKEVNVVAVVVNGVISRMTISDREVEETVPGVVKRHVYPSVYIEKSSAVQTQCQALVDALEIENGIIFPQFMLTKQGPKLIETGERIPGGLMKELFEAATGLDLVSIQLDISLGRSISDINQYKKYCKYDAVVVDFLNAVENSHLAPGNISEVIGLSDIRQAKNIVGCDLYSDPEKTEIKTLVTGGDRFLYIISVGENSADAMESGKEALQQLKITGQNGKILYEHNF